MPPSPRLSARITSSRYLIEMMMISAQNTIDATPSALIWSTVEVVVVERLAERVERAGADVAEDDAERAERQRAAAQRSRAVRPCVTGPARYRPASAHRASIRRVDRPVAA